MTAVKGQIRSPVIDTTLNYKSVVRLPLVCCQADNHLFGDKEDLQDGAGSALTIKNITRGQATNGFVDRLLHK